LPLVELVLTCSAALPDTGEQDTNNNEKALSETQTLRAGHSDADTKIFAPPQTPFPGAQDDQNLISWRWLIPSPTDPVW